MLEVPAQPAALAARMAVASSALDSGTAEQSAVLVTAALSDVHSVSTQNVQLQV